MQTPRGTVPAMVRRSPRRDGHLLLLGHRELDRTGDSAREPLAGGPGRARCGSARGSLKRGRGRGVDGGRLLLLRVRRGAGSAGGGACSAAGSGRTNLARRCSAPGPHRAPQRLRGRWAATTTWVSTSTALRIQAAGHGGQVLASGATWALIADHPLEGVLLRISGSTGSRRLEDPVRLYQVVADGLPDQFPPLRTLTPPIQVPVQLTTFIRRRRELKEVLGLLEGARLVTLTGPGGTGEDPTRHCRGCGGGAGSLTERSSSRLLRSPTPIWCLPPSWGCSGFSRSPGHPRAPCRVPRREGPAVGNRQLRAGA